MHNMIKKGIEKMLKWFSQFFLIFFLKIKFPYLQVLRSKLTFRSNNLH